MTSIIKNKARHINIQLKGFPSKKSSSIYNFKLSKQRTEAIKSLLINKGVNTSSIEILPLRENHTAYSETQVRRVDLGLLIVKYNTLTSINKKMPY